MHPRDYATALWAAIGASSTLLAGGQCLAQASAPTCSAMPTAYNHTYYANPTTLPMALGVATRGDIIYLSSGAYGGVTLNAVNAGFVTVEAGKRQTPVLSSLHIFGSHWIVKGLTVTGLAPAGSGLWGQWPATPALIQVGRGDNFVLQANTVNSLPGQFPWAALTPGVVGPNPLSSGISTENSSCVRILENNISNVFNGIGVGGDQIGNDGEYYEIVNNKIDNFAGDGIDHSVSHLIIAHNLITNGHDLCNNICVHNDGIQGWNYEDKSEIVNTDIFIESNMIIQQASPQLVLPADTLQGITIFDGAWKNVHIINNAIITDAWNGIAITGVDRLFIVNNTVVGTTNRETWIAVGRNSNEGNPSSNIIVRNNLSGGIVRQDTAYPVKNISLDFNSTITNPNALFVLFDMIDASYNLHLSASALSVATGIPALAPKYDIMMTLRNDPIILGAYQ